MSKHIGVPTCKCGLKLNNHNWTLSRQKRNVWRCKHCENIVNNRKYYINKTSYLNNYKKVRQNIRQQVIDYYGGKCQLCNNNNKNVLSLDHINGNGRQHRKTI